MWGTPQRSRATVTSFCRPGSGALPSNCGSGWRAEKTAAAVLLHVPGLVDSAENAARLAAAKHLLDTYLGKPLILKPASPSQILALPSPVTTIPFAAASD